MTWAAGVAYNDLPELPPAVEIETRIANVVERCGVSRPTATKWLNDLVAEGVLIDVRSGRERIFINTQFFDLLLRAEAAPPLEPTLF